MNRQVTQEDIALYHARQQKRKRGAFGLWKLIKWAFAAGFFYIGAYLAVGYDYYNTPAGTAMRNKGNTASWSQMYNGGGKSSLVLYCGAVFLLVLLWQGAMHSHGHYVRVAVRWQHAKQFPPGIRQWCVMHPYGSPIVIFLLTLTGINAIKRTFK